LNTSCTSTAAFSITQSAALSTPATNAGGVCGSFGLIGRRCRSDAYQLPMLRPRLSGTSRPVALLQSSNHHGLSERYGRQIRYAHVRGMRGGCFGFGGVCMRPPPRYSRLSPTALWLNLLLLGCLLATLLVGCGLMLLVSSQRPSSPRSIESIPVSVRGVHAI
jgi:hypothetical protein